MINVYSGRSVNKGLRFAQTKKLTYLAPGNKGGLAGFYFKDARKVLLFYTYAQIDKAIK